VNKFCVALRNPIDSECRLQLGEFPSPERAFQLAELIALELGAEAGGRWLGWTVEVRSLQGQTLFAAPVAGERLPDARAQVWPPLAEAPRIGDGVAGAICKQHI